MNKLQRHRLIARIVRDRPISSQDELRRSLARQGVETTQGTLSRDLRELGVIKGPAGYELSTFRESANGSELRAAAQSLLESVEVAGTIVVVKTAPGNAGALAVQLDRSPPPGAAGCLAGDDTIFLAARSARDARALAGMLKELAGFLA